MRSHRGVPADRFTFVALALQTLVNAFVFSTYVARLPDLREQAGLSSAAIGLVMTLGNLAGMLGAIPAPYLVARFGSRRVLLWAATVYVGTLPLLAVARSPALLASFVVVMMTSNVVCDIALLEQKATFGAVRGGTVMSRMSAIYSLGTLGGALVAAGIASLGLAVRVHLVVLAILLAAVLGALRGGLLSRDQRRAPVDRRRDGSTAVVTVVAIGLASALAVPLDVVPGEWATFRMRDDLGAGSTLGTVAYVAFAAGMTLSRVFGDVIVTRWGARLVCVSSATLGTTAVVVAASVPAIPIACVAFFLAGVGAGVLSPVLSQSAVDSGPGAVRVFFIGDRLAGLLTPVSVGFVAAGLGLGPAMMLVVLPCGVMLLAVTRYAIRR